MNTALNISMKISYVLLLITCCLVYACNKEVKVLLSETKEAKKDSLVSYTNQIDIKQATLIKLYYHAAYTMDLETGGAMGIQSYFVFKGKQYSTPKQFHNNREYAYEYSIFPEYTGQEHYQDVRVFSAKDKYYVLLKSQNPHCNGTHCQSYFLHVLVMNSDSILGNTVYFYNPDVDFNDLEVVFSGPRVHLMQRGILLDVID